MTDLAAIIARVRELDAAATKGPWEIARCGDAPDADACGITVGSMRDRFGGVFTDAAYDECHHIVAVPDAALIAYYRTATPQLATECERLRERVGELSEALAGLADFGHLTCIVTPACGCCTLCDALAALAKGGE